MNQPASLLNVNLTTPLFLHDMIRDEEVNIMWSAVSPQSVSPKQMASEISGMRRWWGGGESWSGDSHPAVCRPHRACFWISDQKLQWRPPLNHGLPNICCHIALNNLFVDPTECMYPSPFLSWAHLGVCACVCALVSLENKMLQSTTTATTKWSAALRNRCATQIELDGIVHTHTEANSTYSTSGRTYFCSRLHPGCLTQLKHGALFQLQHGR